MQERDAVLEGMGLEKSFFGVRVLEGVDICCRKGRVLAIVGENGAGKSTLMNLISGGLRADAGSLRWEGQPVRFLSPREAREAGVAFVHQELSLFPYLTAAENIYLGREPRNKRGLIDARAMHAQARALLGTFGFPIDADQLTAELTLAQRQMVEIAKAWAGQPKLMILDEPTSSLSKTEADSLFRFVANMKAQGGSVVLITHRMDEVFQAADDVIVLKDGKLTLSAQIGQVTRDDLLRAMVGRQTTQVFPPRSPIGPEAKPLLTLKGVGRKGVLRDIDLVVPRGHIVGVGGLEGQGQRALARGIFGIEPFDSGVCLLEGEPVKLGSPRCAMAAGIAYVPDDRKLEGLALYQSVQHNLTMLRLRELSPRGVIRKQRERELMNKCVEGLRIKLASPGQAVRYLSGGNQQKTVFSKWTETSPKLLILHEPTRGIDVNAKLEIYALIRKLADQGAGILLFSSDMLEMIGMTDVIYVLYEGAVMGSVPSHQATEEGLILLSSGLQTHKAKEGDAP